MIRTILRSDKNKLTLQLPNDMVGKTIEIIAFEIEKANYSEDVEIPNPLNRAEAIDQLLSKYRTDLSNYKFDRDEANDHE